MTQLLENPRWSQVVAVGRRAADVPDAAHRAKLQNVIVNMDALEEEGKAAFEGADSVFCALGTSRAQAGTADAFRKVDFEYVAATARAAKSAGVPHFALVSAQGANASLTVTIRSADIAAAPAGTYTGTLQLLIAPQ